MIEARNLSKYYGPTRSIDGISFSVDKGEVLGFLGPNGAGKSTTIRILTGLTRPTAGSAHIGGSDVQTEHDKVRHLIGFLPEQAPSYSDMTLAGYLEFMAGIKGLNRREARREMERTTDLVNLRAERRRLLRNLSKGTRQRAAIAQALLGDPEVLLLDEPTVGLDPTQINDVRKLINSFAGRRTVMLSTHILSEVEMTCTRIVIIANGKIAAAGTPKELTQGGGAELTVVASGDKEKFARVLKEYLPNGAPGIEKEGDHWRAHFPAPPGNDVRAALARSLVEANLDLLELRSGYPRLEDVFLRAVVE